MCVYMSMFLYVYIYIYIYSRLSYTCANSHVQILFKKFICRCLQTSTTAMPSSRDAYLQTPKPCYPAVSETTHALPANF